MSTSCTRASRSAGGCRTRVGRPPRSIAAGGPCEQNCLLNLDSWTKARGSSIALGPACEYAIHCRDAVLGGCACPVERESRRECVFTFNPSGSFKRSSMSCRWFLDTACGAFGIERQCGDGAVLPLQSRSIPGHRASTSTTRRTSRTSTTPYCTMALPRTRM